MVSHNLRALSLSLLIVITVPLQLLAAESAPEALVRAVTEKLFSAAGHTSPQVAFRSLLKQHLDLPALASFSLGKYVKQLPPERGGEYRQLMEDNIVALFAKRAKSFRGDDMKIERVTPRGTNEFVIKTKVHFATGENKPISWRIAKRGDAYKVLDVNVDGIWLALLQRDAFVGAIDKAKGDVNALMTFLKKEN